MMTDLRLNSAELSTLKNLAKLKAPVDHWIEVSRPSTEFRQAIDILVLSGLVERREDPYTIPAPFGDSSGWLDQWRLTPAGIEVADHRPQTSLFTS